MLIVPRPDRLISLPCLSGISIPASEGKRTSCSFDSCAVMSKNSPRQSPRQSPGHLARRKRRVSKRPAPRSRLARRKNSLWKGLGLEDLVVGSRPAHKSKYSKYRLIPPPTEPLEEVGLCPRRDGYLLTLAELLRGGPSPKWLCLCSKRGCLCHSPLPGENQGIQSNSLCRLRKFPPGLYLLPT